MVVDKIKNLKKDFYIKIFLIILCCVAIVYWQKGINKKSLTDDYTRSDSSGMLKQSATAFVYFYYYLDIYPAWTNYEPKTYSVEGAKQLFKEQAETLMMDHSSYILWGEHGKTLLLVFDAFLKGTPKDVTVITFNSYIFMFSLVLLFLSFTYFLKNPLLGGIFVIFLGSNPYQLHEVYIRENIFSLSITTLIILLAINLPLIKETFEKVQNTTKYLLLSAFLSGVVLGTMSHIRAEALSIVLSCMLVYIFVPKINLKIKTLSILVFFLSFTMSTKIWDYYFNIKFDQAVIAVDSVKEGPIDAPKFRDNYHTFWHPLLLGLHDFDDKYGYRWDDNYAYDIASPELINNYPEKFNISQNRETWSVQKEYKEIIKKKFLGSVYNDPIWYMKIISKRLKAMFLQTIPLGVYIKSHFIPIPFVNGLVLIPLICYLLFKRNWFWLKLLLFSLPASSLIILIHASHNVTNISVFHYFAGIIIIYFILERFINSIKILLKVTYAKSK